MRFTSSATFLAACCALVRADAARCAGPIPDTFLNGDDVEWFIRMARRTGGRIVAVPGATAYDGSKAAYWALVTSKRPAALRWLLNACQLHWQK